MTILAIGATGFIGPSLVRYLVQQGHEVVVFHRGETDADLPDAVQHLHGDRRAPPAGRARLRGARGGGEVLRRTVEWERPQREEEDDLRPDYEAEDDVLRSRF